MQLDEQTRLINERGMVLIGNEEEDEDFEKTTEEEQEKRTRAIVSSDTAAILSGNKQISGRFMEFFVYIFADF